MSSSDKNQLAYYIIAGLIKMCRKELALNKKLRITLNESVRDVFAKARAEQEAGNTTDQFVALKPSSIEMLESNDARGVSGAIRTYALANLGLTSPESKTTNDGKQTHAIRFGLIPTKFAFTFWFASPSFEEFVSFFSRWSFARQNRRLNFTLDWMKNALDIEVHQGVSFSVPERNPRWDSSNFSVYEGELEVFGYTSSSDGRDIVSFPSITELVREVKIFNADGEEDLINIPTTLELESESARDTEDG